MSSIGAAASAAQASILVVDDDRRVVELLTIALNAYGYRVLQANDGEEALRVALRERPDLVVLDVRLPKRSGYEVCEQLRQDAEDPQVPIIMVSAAAETEARLQGLSRGADDYVAKPFSPKELIARIRRLLTRAGESREARLRSRAAEHELGQAREDARRSHAELRDHLRLRDLGEVFARDFHASLDLETLTRRLLLEAQAQLGSGAVILLACDETRGTLAPAALRGDVPERASALRIDPAGDLATLLAGLGRPVRRADLDRFPELRRELQPFIAAGIAVFAPLRVPEGSIGVLLADERIDGAEIDGRRLEALELLCHTAAVALRNASRAAAQAEALLDALEAWALRDHESTAIAERAQADSSATSGMDELSAELRRDVARALRLSEWTATTSGAEALAAMVARDGSGRVARLARLLAAARDVDTARIDDPDPGFERAVEIVRTALSSITQHARECSDRERRIPSGSA